MRCQPYPLMAWLCRNEGLLCFLFARLCSLHACSMMPHPSHQLPGILSPPRASPGPCAAPRPGHHPRPPAQAATTSSPSATKRLHADGPLWQSFSPVSAFSSSTAAPWTSPSTSPAPSAGGPPLLPLFPSAEPCHH
jgi:hypothetical protein